jgi:hypothetical protein
MLPASSLLKITRFPLSRCRFVFDQVRTHAQGLDIPAIVALAEHGMARATEAMELDHRQRVQPAAQFPPETREVDQLVDATVDALDNYCQIQIAMFRGEERAPAAARIQQALLPEGVGAITQLPYAEQHGQVTALLERAQEPDVLADLAVVPELHHVLARMGELNERYGVLIVQSRGELLTRQDVRARHAECQEILCTLACLIIGHFAMLPERHADRDLLLDLILRQDKALRERRRRRRANSSAGDDAPDDIVAEPDDEI